MKKLIITTTILGLTMFSCKKEKEDLTVVGKDVNGNELVVTESGDTIQKTQDNDSIAITTTENTTSAFTKNEDETYNFQYNLTKGKTYPINLKVITTRNVSDGKQSVKMTSESRKKIDYTVQDYGNGVYTLKVTFRQYSEKMADPSGKSMAFDTDVAKPSDPMLAMSWQVYKSIIGKSYTMKVSNKGKVQSVDGLAQIRSGIETAMKSTFKSTEEQKNFSEMLKYSLGEEAIKSQFEETMNIYPEKSLKMKESWSDENKINEGPLTGNSKVTRTLDSMDKESTKIKVNGSQNVNGSQSQKIPTQDGKEVNLKKTLSENSSISGNILLETESGWIKKIDITQKKTTKETLEAQGEKQSGTEHTTVQTIVN